MPARLESAVKDATKAVPSGEKLTDTRDGGGNGSVVERTPNDCPWVYSTSYSDAASPLNVTTASMMPVLTVVSVPMEAYEGINGDSADTEKLPGIRLLTDAVTSLRPCELPLSLAPMEMTSLPFDDGNASIVTLTALPALEPWNTESTLIATVIFLQHCVVIVILDLMAVASDANVPKLLCITQ